MEALGINAVGLISQAINFLILLGLLYMLLYRPILRMLDQRSVRIRESLEQAERVRQQAQQAQADFQVQIEQARREGQEIVAQASKIGEQVKIGQVIGLVGSTGRSTGPHLHYETRIDGEAVDPQKFLRAGLRLGNAL